MARASGPAAACDRLHQLDALRGIAALVVVLHHALLSLPAGDALPTTLHAIAVLRIVELGRPAVILFFVLSGFALALCLERSRDTFAGFAVRRAVRLLPPYWATIVASYLMYRMLAHDHTSSFSPWFSSQWAEPISNFDFTNHLTMRAGPRQFPLAHVAWSLVHEMRLSLVVPLLVVIAMRGGAVMCLALATAISCAASLVIVAMPNAFPAGIYGFRFDAESLVPSLILSARYVLPFAAGVLLARRRVATAAWLDRSRGVIAVGLLGSVGLLSQTNEILMLAGGAGLVALVAGSPSCARALSGAPLVWLGRVSYSLYLVHLPVLLVFGHALDGRLPPRLILGLAVAFALVLAELVFRLVERPSIDWSRATGHAVAARMRARAPQSIAEAAGLCTTVPQLPLIVAEP